MLHQKKRLTCCFGLFLILGVLLDWSWRLRIVSAATEPTSPFRLTAAWTEAGLNKDVKSWTLSDLSKFKKTESQEKDPGTGKVVKWKGILLSLLVEKALNDLSPEDRAHIDLVILKGSSGSQALIPRAVITKYPVLLALQTTLSNSDPSVQSRGPISSVVPWSTKPKILAEGLPLETYFVSNLERIELTSYKDHYRSLYLKRRTDPSAMRGERLFVQNCVSCHTEGDTKVYHFGQIGPLTAAEHPAMKAALKLNEKDKKSLVSYLNAYKGENLTSSATPRTSGDALTSPTTPKQTESAQKSLVQ